MCITHHHDARVSLRVAVFYVSVQMLTVRKRESDVFYRVVLSPFAHLPDFLYDVFDSVKIIRAHYFYQCVSL